MGFPVFMKGGCKNVDWNFNFVVGNHALVSVCAGGIQIEIFASKS
jgi:hypothetical protein